MIAFSQRNVLCFYSTLETMPKKYGKRENDEKGYACSIGAGYVLVAVCLRRRNEKGVSSVEGGLRIWRRKCEVSDVDDWKPEIRLTVEFMAGAFPAMFVIAGMGVDSDIGAYLAIAFGIVVCIIIELNRSKKRNSAVGFLSYNKETDTLTVNARRLENGNVIKIEEMVDYNLKYHPPEIVYTGVTVGGVHTGGFHEQGNYYSLNGTSTKKYRLVYTGAGVSQQDFCPIEKIELSAPLIREAQENKTISRYLDDDGVLTLCNKVESQYGTYMESVRKQGNTELLMQMAKSDWFAQQLSKAQCSTIRDWLMSTDN